MCLMSPALTGEFFTTSATWEAPSIILSPLYSHVGDQVKMKKWRPGWTLPRSFNSTAERDFPSSAVDKTHAPNTGGPTSIPGLGRSPGRGHGNPLQYSCLENPTDRGAWQATVHRVTKSWTQVNI